MHGLIRSLFLKSFDNPILAQLGDSARLKYKEELAFTTDSFVVSPLFFPGADIGKLAVCGTVNDLVMAGAEPQFLSLSLIIEEGLEEEVLEKVIKSVAFHAKKAGVMVVTGDTKVVESGAADKLFINTSGIGMIISKGLSMKNIRFGDKIILTGTIAEHGLAVLSGRKAADLGFNINSDCASLNSLILPLLRKRCGVKFMRDPTRGGVATTLNEIALGSCRGIIISEKDIPILPKVRADGELLGIDPLYIANEGKAILVVKAESAQKVLSLLRKSAQGSSAAIIGEFTGKYTGRVVMRTRIGTERVIDMLAGDLLPRIC